MTSDASIHYRSGHSGDLNTLLQIDLDASRLFEHAGLFLDLPEDHEFSVSERERLRASLEAGKTIVAKDGGAAVGFIAVGQVDGQPYVDQISVRQSHMRRGIGATLLHSAFASAARRGDALWLTTYGHLVWNRPFYERNGFELVPEPKCGPGIRAELEFQRRWLPQPEHRVAMRRLP